MDYMTQTCNGSYPFVFHKSQKLDQYLTITIKCKDNNILIDASVEQIENFIKDFKQYKSKLK